MRYGQKEREEGRRGTEERERWRGGGEGDEGRRGRRERKERGGGGKHDISNIVACVRRECDGYTVYAREGHDNEARGWKGMQEERHKGISLATDTQEDQWRDQY